MLTLMHKSLRFAVLGFLLFAGATDLFSVDLDQDGESETEAIVAFDHVASVRKCLPSAEEHSSTELPAFHSPRALEESAHLFMPQPPTGCASGSPHLLVPLRT